MASIGKVSAVFTASTSGLSAGVNRASAAMKGLQADASGLRSSMNALVAIQGAALFGSIVSGATSAARSLFQYGAAAAGTIDDTSKMAARLGMTYGEFAGLSLAADLAGVSMDQIGKAITKADVAFVKAANGSKQASAAFAAIGLSANALNNMSAAERFDAIAEAIARLPTEAQRSAAAIGIFGKAGADLIPLFSEFAPSFEAARAEAVRLGASLSGLRTPEALQSLANLGFDTAAIDSGRVSFEQIAAAIARLPTEIERSAAATAVFGAAGAELSTMFSESTAGLSAMRAEAERFGLTLTNEQGKNVESMNDAFTRAQAAIQGVVQQVVAYLAPAIDAVVTSFSNLIGSVGGANIGQAIGDGILQGARFLAQIGDYIIQNFSSVFQYLSSVGGQWNVVWQVGQRVVDFLAGVGRLFEAVFKGVASIIAGVAGTVTQAAASLAKSLGFDQVAAQLDAAGQSLQQSSKEMWKDAGTAMTAAGENFQNAIFGRPLEEAGQVMAGPLVTALDQAIANAQDAAAQVDVAAKQQIEVKQTIDTKGLKDAVKGIESASADGIKEMFRIMRGPQQNDVQQQQLEALERIADNTEDMGGGLDDLAVLELAPAAGG